jgi:hypothetical protein
MVGAGPVSPPSPPVEEPCRCRINGTLEVDSDRPLQERTAIEISLTDDLAARDTVELFMGSPRAFDLGLRPCATHRLRLQILTGRPFFLVSDAPIDCAGGGRSVRLVLVPSGRGWTLR